MNSLSIGTVTNFKGKLVTALVTRSSKSVTNPVTNSPRGCHQFRDNWVQKLQPVTMPNPRLSVRMPQQLYEQLPADEKERSALIIRLIEGHLKPANPEDRLTQLERKFTTLETEFSRHFT